MSNELDSDMNHSSEKKPTLSKRDIFNAPVYGLLSLAILYTLYFAKSLLMPILVALLFSLLLSPLVSLLKRLYIPRGISAILLLAMIGGPMALLTIELAQPAQKWVEQLPKLSAQLTEEIDNISQIIKIEPEPEIVEPTPVEKEKSSGFFSWFSNDDEEVETPIVIDEAESESALLTRVTQGGIDVLVSILVATPLVLAQFMTFLFLVIFLLIFGPGLYESYLKILPAKTSNRRSIALIGKLQQQLSRYIITVTIINAVLGMTVGVVFWMMGFNDALLWGALVGLLNFAPYLGSLMSLIILSLAGVTQYGTNAIALLPAAIFFGVNMLEAQLITPAILGRHMQLNPLIIILWLLMWGWLWGAIGVLIAVPLLVCIKLAAEQLKVFNKWVSIIETKP